MDGNLISFVFSILTVIVGGVCIMLFVSTKTLRDSRDDMEHRIVQLESERNRDKELLASQKTEIDILRNTVTGESHLVELKTMLRKHHQESTDQGKAILAALSHVGITLDSVDEHLVALQKGGVA